MADNLRQVVLKDLKVWQADEGETFYTAGGSGTTRTLAHNAACRATALTTLTCIQAS